MKNNQLRTKIIGIFVGLTLIISILYGLMSFVIAYYVEDHFFNSFIEAESHAISAQIKQGLPAEPRLDYVTYYPQYSAMPLDVREFLEKHPDRKEFALNDEQYFHLKPFEHGYLLAEVSNQLFVRSVKNELLSFLLAIFAFATFIAIVMGFAAYLIAKRLLKPLDELITIIEQAPVDKLPNDFAKRFEGSEIGTFAHTLEQALTRIDAFIKREQLFTRDISHELRTPITISQGAITLLKQTSLNDKQANLVTRVSQAQQQIEQSLTTLLALAREQHKQTAHSRILPLVEQSILQQHNFLADKAIELVINIKPQETAPIAEPPLLILLNNLIGNAFKYTHSGTIEITYSQQSLSIKDSGSGISPELQTQIFEAGVKGESSQGFGLGLNIVKRLCEHLSIDYQLTSTANGNEFRFTFT
ncbi:sensor histidine kinase [Pseudoalteromonas ulvae]|uniref:histidine kinase n=1 Tax=Pseudoalteromonas ulvae TaxID=107327 RepID=A0A244CL55_PSEDV|nr:HAMP domain-containing sensor histidine kinase [Pseudoalteromonas ulvae]OUL56347.1 two-component sensor histidine kinase [Pseudoalteromonas ulvae]